MAVFQCDNDRTGVDLFPGLPVSHGDKPIQPKHVYWTDDLARQGYGGSQASFPYGFSGGRLDKHGD